jgi:tetratricopeptide (TPR) repeat protein
MPRLAVLLALLFAVPGAAAAQNAPDADRLLARAIELHQAGDIIGAIDSYKAALTIAPDRSDARSNLGAAYVRLGQFDDAIAEYKLALASEPTNTSIRLNLALAYYKSARPQLAVPELRRIVASSPDAKNAYLVLAECYLQLGQDSEVVSLLKPREPMFAGDAAYAYLLGTSLIHLNDLVEGSEVRRSRFRGG